MILPAVLLLAGCASSPKPAATEPPARKVVKPMDDTRYFPRAGQVDSKVVDDHLLGHEFLPGGNIAHYKAGPLQYDLILIRTATPTDAAILLLDFKKHLASPKLIAHFGGYFGADGDRQTFLFTKNNWLCGVIGLPLAEADARGRDFAGRLQ